LLVKNKQREKLTFLPERIFQKDERASSGWVGLFICFVRRSTLIGWLVCWLIGWLGVKLAEANSFGNFFKKDSIVRFSPHLILPRQKFSPCHIEKYPAKHSSLHRID